MSIPKIIALPERDESEAKGRVWIEQSGYGWYVYVGGTNLDEQGKEQPVVLLDLYPASPEGRSTTPLSRYFKTTTKRGTLAQVILYCGDDTLATYRLTKQEVLLTTS